MATAVSFEGFDLTASPYSVVKLDPIGSPSKSTTMFPLARADGSVRTFEKYDSRIITVEGTIISDSQANMESAIDDLKEQLRLESGSLQYDWAGGVRIHECTCTDFNIDRNPGNISFVPYVAQFECESPFATDGVTDTLVSSQSITTATYDMAITVAGTYDAQPVITMTISAINPSVSDTQIIVSNAANSQFLTVEETFTAGDTLLIDCNEFRVFQNGAFVPSTGLFPSFATGAGVLSFESTSTTRTVVLTATAERRYL